METGIEGLLVTPLAKPANPKGHVLKALKKSEKGFAGFGEAYFTTIKPGVVKGWHKHSRMTMNLFVPVGRALFVMHDDRKPQSGQRHFFEVELSPENYCRLTVPVGIWVGFKGLADTDTLVLNISSIEYEDSEVIRTELATYPFDWESRR